MSERSDELPNDVDKLKAMTLEITARAEADVKAARGEVLQLKAEVNDLAEANATAKAEIARLTSILRTLQRGQFGKRSEKLAADKDEQQSFAFEEVETGLEEIGARLAAKTSGKSRAPSASKPRFPSHLERVEEVLEPAIPPGFEDKERVKIGQDESVRLDVVRARFRLIVTIRPKYAFKEPTTILQAPAPEHIIEAGLPTEALLAQVAISKYADGLPLYRQEAIYARDGVELGRSLMAQWMGAVGFHFEPLAAFVLARIREGERIFADETTLPTLDPGAGKTKTAWFWAYARDDRPFGGAGPPMVAYRFEDSRSGDCAARHLGDYRGILQCDGYVGYRKLAGAPHANGLRLAGCWAHLRRRFFDLHANGESVVATATVEQMKTLFGPPRTRCAASRPRRDRRRDARHPPASCRRCSTSGSANCRASPPNRNSPRRSATPAPIAPRCCCSSKTGAPRSTPTSSNALSVPKPLREKIRSSPVLSAEVEHGRLSPPCCRPAK